MNKVFESYHFAVSLLSHYNRFNFVFLLHRVTKLHCQWKCVPIVSVEGSFTIANRFSVAIVDPDEIKRLGKRFRKLDLDNSGSLSIDEFMSLPELQQNPLVQRVIDIFDTDRNGEVDFKGKHTLTTV